VVHHQAKQKYEDLYGMNVSGTYTQYDGLLCFLHRLLELDSGCVKLKVVKIAIIRNIRRTSLMKISN
jgi:hypothetical protein